MSRQASGTVVLLGRVRIGLWWLSFGDSLMVDMGTGTVPEENEGELER